MPASAPKTAVKTAPPSPRTGVSLPVGAHPGNTGGKKGRSGRKPKSFAAFIRGLREGADVQEEIKKAALDRDSKGFGAILKLMAEYDEERPRDKKELSGELVVRVVRDT